VSDSVCVVWDPSLAAYDFGPGHPLAPVRVELTMALADALGVLQAPNVSLRGADVAPDQLLQLVHTSHYLDAVKAALPDDRYGLGTTDVPVFPRMHEASAHVVGATVEAASAVHSGRAQHAVNIAGGLHHAMPSAASGFCVYNDVAVAIAWLLEQGVQRVAYVDVDVHHGDGVQAAFYDDPRVLTVSIHETGRVLFPGSGFPDEVGEGKAAGSSVNIALPAGTPDAGWLRAFHAIVPPVVRAFEPEIIISQHGCDSHVRDPLADLALTVDGQHASYATIHDLAHELCDGRWVATGGGGYALAEVVPRAWTRLLAEAVGAPVDPATQTPGSWRALVGERLGCAAPASMTDGGDVVFTPWHDGHNPADPVDRAILATVKSVFPLHGIDHWL
jgi:acetoin utilization protein AcuC